MKNSKSRVALGGAALLVAAVALGSHNGPYTGTATFFNANGPTQYTLQSDGNNSASYSVTFSPTASEPTYYQMDLDVGTSRSVRLTLVPIKSSPALFGTMAFSGGTLYSRCFTPAGGTSSYQSWPEITTSDGNCAMRVNFTYNDVDYTFVMSPEQPGTGTALVTCTETDASNACVAWTDVPNPGAANHNVAFLYEVPKHGGDIYVGSYWMSFEVTVTHP
jgi:hypothetical protein